MRPPKKKVESAAEAPKKKSAEAVSGRTLGRYVLERTLGHGAMATVYLGVDPTYQSQGRHQDDGIGERI